MWYVYAGIHKYRPVGMWHIKVLQLLLHETELEMMWDLKHIHHRVQRLLCNIFGAVLCRVIIKGIV